MLSSFLFPGGKRRPGRLPGRRLPRPDPPLPRPRKVLVPCARRGERLAHVRGLGAATGAGYYGAGYRSIAAACAFFRPILQPGSCHSEIAIAGRSTICRRHRRRSAPLNIRFTTLGPHTHNSRCRTECASCIVGRERHIFWCSMYACGCVVYTHTHLVLSTASVRRPDLCHVVCRRRRSGAGLQLSACAAGLSLVVGGVLSGGVAHGVPYRAAHSVVQHMSSSCLTCLLSARSE